MANQKLTPAKRRKLRKKEPHPVQRMKAYNGRNVILSSMGFKTYKDYLKSPLWQAIRSAFLAKHPNCLGCGATATQVHHSAYTKESLAGRDAWCLYAVCSRCHRRIEFRDRDQEKLSPRQATKKLKQIRAYRDRLLNSCFATLLTDGKRLSE